MEKFLFTNGKQGITEVQSIEEFQRLVDQAGDTSAVRIWLFNTSEWISYASFIKRYPGYTKKDSAFPTVKQEQVSAVYTVNGNAYSTTPNVSTKKRRRNPAVRVLYVVGLLAIAFLVFNFTRINWKSGTPLNISAARPANVPYMDVDSLIREIEYVRGQTLDKSTKTNLRLRNTWPDLIQLQLVADRENSNAGSRFRNIDVSIDNSTGLNIDNAVVKLSVWKNNKVILNDTVQFSGIKYDKKKKRELEYRYKGDSLSVAFETIRAKSFNFYYSAGMKNNPGDYNDRWFSKE